MTDRPLGRAGMPAPAPLRTTASPASQALVAVAAAVTFAALAARTGSPLWCAAPTAALLVGILIGVQLDLRRWFAPLPGVIAGLVTVVLLSLLWAALLGWLAVELPYALVPLAALVVVGADWWWVERLRPLVVATGVLLVPALENDVAAALPLALLWFGVVAAALWSLRGDVGRALPTPLPLDGSPTPVVEPGAARTALAVAASWLVAGLVVALIGLVPGWLRAPEAPGGFGAAGTFGAPGSGPGSGSGSSGGGGDIGPSGTVDAGIQGGDDAPRDVDGDGIPDRDIDGDGTPDVDIDGDGIPDVDADGDGVPDESQEGRPPGLDPTQDEVFDGGRDTPGGDDGATDAAVRADAARVAGSVVVALLGAALLALAGRAVRRELSRRRALAARPWAVRLAERLDREGARRGRVRRRDEPVTRYAAALAGGVLAHDRLPEVGTVLSAALFGAGTPSDATGDWAASVVDEAVAANPPPRWFDPLRDRLRRRRPPA